MNAPSSTGRVVLEERFALRGDLDTTAGPIEAIAGLAYAEGQLYVSDFFARVVKIYNVHGGYLGQLGGPGEGPGEFGRPGGIAVAADGVVFVRDSQRPMVHRFGTDGRPLPAWRLEARVVGDWPVVLDRSGRILTVVRLGLTDLGLPRLGVQAFDAEGPAGTPRELPVALTPDQQLVARRGGSMRAIDAPFVHGIPFAFDADGTIAVGRPGAYRVTITYADDVRQTLSDPRWSPVRVEAEERDWHRRRVVAFLAGMDPDWRWPASQEIQTSKPAVSRLFLDGAGRLWVVRPGRGVRHEECDDELPVGARDPLPCWTDRIGLDLWSRTGELMLRTILPEYIEDVRFLESEYDLLFIGAETVSGHSIVQAYELVHSTEERHKEASS